MAKADQIKRLIGSFGRPSEFRAAALKIIEEEQRKGHMPLAASLKRVLDASVQVEEGSKRGLTALSNAPESAVDLVEILEPARSLKQVVLFAEARSAIERVLEEQRRGDELRQHRLPVRSKVLLHGPPGCGKTLTAEVLARELGLPLYVAKIDVIISSCSARRQAICGGYSISRAGLRACFSWMSSTLSRERAAIPANTTSFAVWSIRCL
jgi:hypothetical protein